jgi:hypothetical protein
MKLIRTLLSAALLTVAPALPAFAQSALRHYHPAKRSPCGWLMRPTGM